MSRLQLAPDLSLPREAVTETFGILAVRGAGKSNTAAVMAEEMFKASLPFVVVDPVGSWWGLRSSRDGKEKGLPLPIFGGKHGDVPLERGAGQLVADLVVDQRLSCVLDLSAFDSEKAKKEFLLAFAQRLYRRNEAPLHLFLEEADDYIPQRPMGNDDNYLLRAWENIVRRGRSRGLGMTLITQRSASLNKNVLTQVQTLIAMRTTGPQDRKAIEEWLKYHAQSHEIIESLPGLQDGEAWVWSPDFLRKTVRVQFRRRETYDSAATPTLQAARAPATLADVDLGALTERMAATIEKAKQEDPKLLRQENARLRRDLDQQKAVALAHAQGAQVREKVVEKRVEVPILKDAQLKRLEGVSTKLVQFGERVVVLGQDVVRVGQEIVAALAKLHQSTNGGHAHVQGRVHEVLARRVPLRPVRQVQRSAPPPPVGEEFRPNAAQQRILDSLAWLQVLGVTEASRTQLALLSEMKPTGGYYNNCVGALRTAGLVTYPSSGTVAITDAGQKLADPGDVPQTSEELQEQVLGMVNALQKKILEHVIANYPDAVTREDLAAAVDASAEGGYFSNMVGALRTMGVVEYPGQGQVRAASVLFLEGAGV